MSFLRTITRCSGLQNRMNRINTFHRSQIQAILCLPKAKENYMVYLAIEITSWCMRPVVSFFHKVNGANFLKTEPIVRFGSKVAANGTSRKSEVRRIPVSGVWKHYPLSSGEVIPNSHNIWFCEQTNRTRDIMATLPRPIYKFNPSGRKENSPSPLLAGTNRNGMRDIDCRPE